MRSCAKLLLASDRVDHKSLGVRPSHHSRSSSTSRTIRLPSLFRVSFRQSSFARSTAEALLMVPLSFETHAGPCQSLSTSRATGPSNGAAATAATGLAAAAGRTIRVALLLGKSFVDDVDRLATPSAGQTGGMPPIALVLNSLQTQHLETAGAFLLAFLNAAVDGVRLGCQALAFAFNVGRGRCGFGYSSYWLEKCANQSESAVLCGYEFE